MTHWNLVTWNPHLNTPLVTWNSHLHTPLAGSAIQYETLKSRDLEFTPQYSARWFTRYPLWNAETSWLGIHTPILRAWLGIHTSTLRSTFCQLTIKLISLFSYTVYKSAYQVILLYWLPWAYKSTLCHSYCKHSYHNAGSPTTVLVL